MQQYGHTAMKPYSRTVIQQMVHTTLISQSVSQSVTIHSYSSMVMQQFYIDISNDSDTNHRECHEISHSTSKFGGGFY